MHTFCCGERGIDHKHLKRSVDFAETGDLISNRYRASSPRPSPELAHAMPENPMHSWARPHCSPPIFESCHLKKLEPYFLHFHIFKMHTLKAYILAGIKLYGQ